MLKIKYLLAQIIQTSTSLRKDPKRNPSTVHLWLAFRKRGDLGGRKGDHFRYILAPLCYSVRLFLPSCTRPPLSASSDQQLCKLADEIKGIIDGFVVKPRFLR